MMWDDNVILMVTAAYVVNGKEKKKKSKSQVRPTLQGRNKFEGSQLTASLIKDESFTTGGHFFNFIRMSVEHFKELRSTIESIIKKKKTPA